MKILISACLLGENCKYNGKNNLNSKIKELENRHEILAVCPELLGGLPCPRIPCEMNKEGQIIGSNGEDFTKHFKLGAQKAAAIAQSFKPDLAILQKRSPSCGINRIYDGTFSKQLIKGDGLFAKEVKSMKIPILVADSENKR